MSLRDSINDRPAAGEATAVGACANWYTGGGGDKLHGNLIRPPEAILYHVVSDFILQERHILCYRGENCHGVGVYWLHLLIGWEEATDISVDV